MPTRDHAVQIFLTGVHDALAACSLGPDGSAAIERIYGALASPEHPGAGPTQRMQVCADHLPQAYETARLHSPAMARIVDAFAAIEPALFWAPRGASGPHASATWPEGHANAMIVGPGGLESRSDVQIGVSLLAPHVRYPDHNHGPEEVYLVLSPGRFQHGESGWFEPGVACRERGSPRRYRDRTSGGSPVLAAAVGGLTPSTDRGLAEATVSAETWGRASVGFSSPA